MIDKGIRIGGGLLRQLLLLMIRIRSSGWLLRSSSFKMEKSLCLCFYDICGSLEIVEGTLELQKYLFRVVAVSCSIVLQVKRIQDHKV